MDKSEFIHLPQLFNLLEHFADSIVSSAIHDYVQANNARLAGLICSKAVNLDFFVEADVPDGAIEHVEKVAVEIASVHVVEANAGAAVVNLSCNIFVMLFASASDPESSIYDHEHDVIHYVHRMFGSIEREIQKTVIVMLKYQDKKPEDVSIMSVGIEDPSVPIKIFDGELVEFYGDERHRRFEVGDLEEPIPPPEFPEEPDPTGDWI